jgi:AcrR family transcriptional regulator
MSRTRINLARPALSRKFLVVHQRRRLIDAIVALTSEQGYGEVTVSEIVRSAHVSRATFYENFKSKEDLFLTAVDVILAEVEVGVKAACEEEEPDWEMRVGRGLRAFLFCADDRRDALRVCMVDALAVPAGLVLYETAIQRYVEMLRAQATAGSNLPETIEEMVVGGVASTIRQRLQPARAGRLIDLQPELVEFVTAPYRSALSAAR